MYYYNNELPPQQGWVCPKCGRVNAPWKSSCDCVSTQTTGTGTAYLVKTSSISRDSHEIAEQTEPQKKMCANCKHIKKHNGKLADYVCDRKGSIDTNPYDKECDEMWEQTEPQTDCAWK